MVSVQFSLSLSGFSFVAFDSQYTSCFGSLPSLMVCCQSAYSEPVSKHMNNEACGRKGIQCNSLGYMAGLLALEAAAC